ncbi:MAG: 16S rRNA (guanine(966)-N(2))-methyltransferase RsmD [Legionella sp.]|nr:16S rRNA (guanine(966)-N(2))-methyltransferase RsmD [Legionella sp.]
MKQTVRIIGGNQRGKNINFPSALGLRPTPSRIRETLFNWLMHSIRGARCLDAFSGSGALGFEAWSRGATHVTLIEASRNTCSNLKKQAILFDASVFKIIEGNALDYLNNASDQFDIIFLDPPFDAPDLLEKSIILLEQNNMLSKQGLIYTESREPLKLDATHWKTLKEKKAGLVYYALHQKQIN